MEEPEQSCLHNHPPPSLTSDTVSFLSCHPDGLKHYHDHPSLFEASDFNGDGSLEKVAEAPTCFITPFYTMIAITYNAAALV
jgi:hypothetical protein